MAKFLESERSLLVVRSRSSQFGASSRRLSRKIILGLASLIVLVSTGIAALMLSSAPRASEAVAAERLDPDRVSIQFADALVAASDIPAGAALEARLVRIEKRPAIDVPSRAIKSIEELKGQFARGFILAGTLLSRDHATKVRPTSALSASIPDGYRAVTIMTDVRSSVEGWVQPGARVDVTLVHSTLGRPALSVIVQNARVLAVERKMEKVNQSGGMVPSTVSLLVTMEEASKIQLAQNNGTLSLALRGDADRGKGMNRTSITTDDLLGRAALQMKERKEQRVQIKNDDGSYAELELVDGKLLQTGPK